MKAPAFLANKKSVLTGVSAFALTGTALLIYTNAAVPSYSAEAETGLLAGPASIIDADNSASNNGYVLFSSSPTPSPSPTAAPSPTPTTPPSSGTRPTRANTGPRYALNSLSVDDFFATKTCNKQRISGDVSFDQQWMKGQTFTLTDCEITGTLRIYITGGGSILQLNEMPIITMDYVDIIGGITTLNAAKMTVTNSYIDGGSQFSLDDVWAPFVDGPAPMSFANTVFYGPYYTQPTHAEPLHAGDYGSGYRFTNVAFLQQSGPLNNTGITATINFHGKDTIFDGCWFIWEGSEVPAYITAYLDAGGNSVVKNSKFSAAPAGYIYDASTFNPTFQNNTDVTSGAPVTFP